MTEARKTVLGERAPWHSEADAQLGFHERESSLDLIQLFCLTMKTPRAARLFNRR